MGAVCVHTVCARSTWHTTSDSTTMGTATAPELPVLALNATVCMLHTV